MNEAELSPGICHKSFHINQLYSHTGKLNGDGRPCLLIILPADNTLTGGSGFQQGLSGGRLKKTANIAFGTFKQMGTFVTLFMSGMVAKFARAKRQSSHQIETVGF